VWPPAERQSARAAIEALMRERGLARGFERRVQRAAMRARDRGLDAYAGSSARRDLTSLPTFTIDPASARDFDDAISAEAVSEGAIRVWVHIADVSAYVEEGSLLDVEARRRATSVYVPGAVEPMLPEALSNGACSLQPGSERLAVTVELELQGADVLSTSFYRSMIRSDERLDYESVDRIFAGHDTAGEPWRASLRAARTAAAALQLRREQSGALVVESEEPEFSFDAHGNISEIRGRAQSESHRLIEHLMIAANEAVAGLLQRRGVPCLYRVHERPEPERIERLVAQLASLEVPTPPLPEHMSPSQAAELVGAISKRVDDHVRRTGRGRLALSSLVLRSLKQAYYSPKNLGHAGLRSASYCHFTSPIRRYPDIVCHRALLSAIGGAESAPRAGELSELGSWSSEREREAMMIEREADDVACCFALEQALYAGGFEQAFHGEVVGLISAGAFVAFGGESSTVASPSITSASVGSRRGKGGKAGAAEQASFAEAVYEGLLPVRRMQVPAAGRAPGGRAARPSGTARRTGSPGSRGAQSSSEWWEINELATILRGERTGATVRLGDPIDVQVARVDALRGRVDLVPADDQERGADGVGRDTRDSARHAGRRGRDG
jgi:ribonuclease R